MGLTKQSKNRLVRVLSENPGSSRQKWENTYPLRARALSELPLHCLVNLDSGDFNTSVESRNSLQHCSPEHAKKYSVNKNESLLVPASIYKEQIPVEYNLRKRRSGLSTCSFNQQNSGDQPQLNEDYPDYDSSLENSDAESKSNSSILNVIKIC